MNMRLMSAACAATLACVAAARAATVVDQSNSATPYQNYNAGAYSPVGQSFVPTQTAVGFVDARLEDAGSDVGPGADFQATIRDGSISGAVLGTSDVVRATDNASGYYRFTFATPAAVTPGQAYVLRLTQLSTGVATSNFMWTAGQFNSYASGDPIRSGATVSNAPDFLFATGRSTSTAAAASGAIAPFAYGGITDADANGTPDTLDAAPYVAMNQPPAMTRSSESRSAFEYDVARFDGANLKSATISGTLYTNNYLDTGSRSIKIELFRGDGTVTLADYAAAATATAGTFAYNPANGGSVAFSFDVTAALNALINTGPAKSDASFVGVRFSAANVQSYSVFTSDVPLLTVTTPEPASLAAIAGAATLGLGRRRRR